MGRAPVENRIAVAAVTAARAAGDILRRCAGEPRKVDSAEAFDVKLEADRLCERAILEVIRTEFPEHSVLAEESGSAAGSDYEWIIDPLDGTVNFYYGLPYYAVSVACYATAGRPAPANGQGLDALGHPIVGVVYVPPTEELFVARPGGGATLNGRPIRVGEQTSLAESIVCTGYGKAVDLGERMAGSIARLVGKVRKIRCLGAAAYDYCNVAVGRLTGFFEAALRTWDVAAGAIVLAEAGGVCRAERTGPDTWRVLAAAPGVVEELREELADLGWG
jgi:fructose-1,6-bisphosphatase/inositol monophosphatase family enzyme